MRILTACMCIGLLAAGALLSSPAGNGILQTLTVRIAKSDHRAAPWLGPEVVSNRSLLLTDDHTNSGYSLRLADAGTNDESMALQPAEARVPASEDHSLQLQKPPVSIQR